MRAVVIGDVSWRGDYHLGDEAMTEAAVLELGRRGVDVTLIAGTPEISAEFYGVPTASQFGFRALKTRKEWEARLDELSAVLAGEGEIPDYARDALAAVEDADAVVIAGGGNLNSSWGHHIFERLALKRAAEARGIPLYISSQTVGPHLLPEDRALVRELVDYARVFGARETGTLQLMRSLVGDEAPIVRTLDDAILLDPSMSAADARAAHDLPERYVVGSFTFHAGSSDNDHEEKFAREEYYRRVAKILDQIVDESGADIVLLPHMGRMSPDDASNERSDVHGHDRIVSFCTSGRVRSMPMMQTRELLAVTAGAEFTVSTRYHPVVFGGGVGVPAIGLVTSYYSATRMRGALANVGMESLAIPLAAWRPLLGGRVLAAFDDRRDELTAHVASARERQRGYQSHWWDGIVADIAGTGQPLTDDLEQPEPFLWGDAHDDEVLDIVRTAAESTDLHRWNQSLKTQRTNSRVAEAERRLRRSEKELAELQRQVAEMRHRMRPPGAELRDRVRWGLRRMRNGNG